MAKPPKIRLLMIGPGKGIISGITALIDTYLPTLKKRVLLYYLPSVNWRPLKYSGVFTFRNLLIAFSQYIRFLIALILFRPNIIHVHTSQGIAWLKDTFFIMVGKFVGCHTVLNIHGGNFDEICNKDARFLQIYTQKIFGVVDAVIAVSAEWKKRLENFCPENRIHSISNCIDVQTIQPNVFCAKKGKVHILFIGRIGPSKGAFDLIDAIHMMKLSEKDIHVWMVGPEEKNGDMQAAQKRLERYQLENTCELVGSVDHEKALQFFQESSFFVLPSYFEGLPMVILEALSAGLPIIATPVGGIPDVIKDGYNGFLVPVGDVQALACKILELVRNENLRKTMGLRSREIAENNLDVQCYVDQLVQLYLQILCN